MPPTTLIVEFIDRYKEAYGSGRSAPSPMSWVADSPRQVITRRGSERIVAARSTVERLMTTLGLQGARRGPVKRTAVPDPAATRAQESGKRDFNQAPNKLWVAEA